MLVGIQISPHVVLGEGVGECLDFLRDTAGVNALMLNTHGYYGAANGWRPSQALADDHPRNVPDPGDGSLERPWVRHDAKRFADLPAGHRDLRREADPWSGCDVYAGILQAARQRGMQVHGRYLEGWETARRRHIPGWEAYLAENCDGEPMIIPCFARPHYRQWWQRTVEDGSRAYDLDGFFFGFERGSTLSDVLMHQQRPYCFCSHCCDRAAEAGVDVERARAGYRKLYGISNRAADPEAEAPAGGWMLEALRIILEYPEIVAWDRLEHEGKQEWERLGAETVRGSRAGTRFTAIAHQDTDPFKAARRDWSAMPGYADYAVIRCYNTVQGARIKAGASDPCKTILRDVPPQTRYALTALWSAWPAIPQFDNVDAAPVPAQQAADAVARCVGAVQARIPVYAGLGLDIPDPKGKRRPTSEDFIAEVVPAVIEAGAGGLVLCREYEEISRASLRAIGRAMAEL